MVIWRLVFGVLYNLVASHAEFRHGFAPETVFFDLQHGIRRFSTTRFGGLYYIVASRVKFYQGSAAVGVPLDGRIAAV